MKDNSSKPIEWKSAEYHRKEIFNLLDKISDSWILWQMHRFIVNITRRIFYAGNKAADPTDRCR